MMNETLTCPACGDALEDGDEIPDSIEDGNLRVAIDCPTCVTPLRVEFDDLDPRTGDVAVSVVPREE